MRKFVLPKEETYRKFKNIFGTDLANFKDILIMALTGRFEFDIIGFENFLKREGYNPEGGISMRDFVAKKYGKDAEELISFLLRF